MPSHARVTAAPRVAVRRSHRHACASRSRRAREARVVACDAASSWFALDPVLSARDDATAMASMRSDIALSALSPTWRMLLLSDGSVTRHLAVLYGARKTEVEVRWQGEDDGVGRAAPNDVKMIKGDRIIRREVFLRPSALDGDGRGVDEDGGGATPPAVYASSWWSETEMKKFMPERESSMWANLRTQHVELYREIRMVYCGHSAELEEVFQAKGPFWGRHYIFWNGGEPITIVYEVFNPSLVDVLGPLEA